MRRRRSLAALLVVLVGLAVGLTFALRSPSGGTGSTPFTSSVRTGELKVSVPRGFYSYALRGGFYRVGTLPPVIGHLLTDFRLPPHVDGWKALDRWASQYGSGPPTHGVALKLAIYPMGPVGPGALRLPLTLREPLWAQEKLESGGVGYRYGDLRVRNRDYELMYWSGPKAPARDRAAILQALKSIRPAR